MESQRQSDETGIGGDASRRNPQNDLECLSGVLRDEIFRQIYKQALRLENDTHSSVFGDFSEQCIDQLALRIEEEVFQRNEKINLSADIDSDPYLYFLFEGEVDVFLAGKKLREFRTGFLNYQQFFDSSKLRELEYVSRSQSLVFKISQKKITQVLENHQNELQIFFQQRDEILMGNNRSKKLSLSCVFCS